MVRAELFQVSSAPPDAVWAVVGDPWRLAEWTDAERVTGVAPEPLQVGSEILTVQDGATRVWRVITAQPRLLELRTATPHGVLELGCRVAVDPRGARLVLAAALESSGLRARLVDAPALRRRLERWCHAAVLAAAPPA